MIESILGYLSIMVGTSLMWIMIDKIAPFIIGILFEKEDALIKVIDSIDEAIDRGMINLPDTHKVLEDKAVSLLKKIIVKIKD